MERIIALSETSPLTPQLTEVDSETFSKMPIWQFYSLTQDAYLQKTNEEKIRLIENYYKSMMKGKSFFL